MKKTAALLTAAFLSLCACGGKEASYDLYLPDHNENPFEVDLGYAKSEIALDGVFDEEQWANARELRYGNYIYENRQRIASFRGFYGENGLYVGMHADATYLVTGNNDLFNNSCLELYIDAAGTAGEKPGTGTEYMMVFDAKEASAVFKGENGGWVSCGFVKMYTMLIREDGSYNLELFIPYSQLGEVPRGGYGIAMGVVYYSIGETVRTWCGAQPDPQVPATYWKLDPADNVLKQTKTAVLDEGMAMDGRDDDWAGFGEKSWYCWTPADHPKKSAVKTHFTQKGVYLFFKSYDTNILSPNVQCYYNDAVEIVIDSRRDGGSSPQTDDFRIRADIEGSVQKYRGTGDNWKIVGDNIVSGVYVKGTVNDESDEDEYFCIEMFIPWSELETGVPENLEGVTMGIKLCRWINDSKVIANSDANLADEPHWNPSTYYPWTKDGVKTAADRTAEF